MADEHGHSSHDEHGESHDEHAPGPVHSARGGFSLARLFGRGKKEEAPIDPKAPIPVHTPNPPAYNPTFEGWYPANIKYKGLYDLDGLYRFMANWMRQKRFEVFETLYKSKPPELEFRMYGERKVSGFVMNIVKVHYHSWGEYDLDVVANGKKKKMTNARMIITISGEIRAPFEDIFERPRWTSSAIERRLLSLFRKWFMKRELESVYWDSLYYEIYKFHTAIKEYLKMTAEGNAY